VLDGEDEDEEQKSLVASICRGSSKAQEDNVKSCRVETSLEDILKSLDIEDLTMSIVKERFIYRKDAIPRPGKGFADSYVFALFPCPAGINPQEIAANFRNHTNPAKRRVDVDIPLKSITHLLKAEAMLQGFDNGDPGLAAALNRDMAQDFHKVKNEAGADVYRKTFPFPTGLSDVILEDGLRHFESLEVANHMADAVYIFRARPEDSQQRMGATTAYFTGVFMKEKKEIIEQPGFNSPGRRFFGAAAAPTPNARSYMGGGDGGTVNNNPRSGGPKRRRGGGGGGGPDEATGGGDRGGGQGTPDGGAITQAESFDSGFMSTSSHMSP
jgi:hypothetical protein